MTAFQLTRLHSSGSSVGWSSVLIYLEMDGHEVTHYGLDRNLNRYYRTCNGNIYQKQATGWVLITGTRP